MIDSPDYIDNAYQLIVYVFCTDSSFESLEERQIRRRKQEIRKTLQDVSSNLNRIGLKMTTAQFETMVAYDKFQIDVNEPTPGNEDDSVSESVMGYQ